MNGIYAAYVTGKAGNSIILFVIINGTNTGVDVGGMKYDGSIKEKDDKTGYTCSLVYVVPAGVGLITGGAPLTSSTPVPLTFDLPLRFMEPIITRIETPLGPVNARFEKLKDLAI